MLSVAEYGPALGVIKPSPLNEWPAGIFRVATPACEQAGVDRMR
jgi:hypothetical protein